MTFRYIIGLGSNDRPEERVAGMIEELLKAFGEVCLSPVCRTEPADCDGPEYLNAVASVESALAPPEFRFFCKDIEARLGRVRPSSVCAADMDLLACWEQPSPTRARDFIQEAYFQPQADSVLAKLGLRCECSPILCTETVSLALRDGRLVGKDTLQLRAA